MQSSLRVVEWKDKTKPIFRLWFIDKELKKYEIGNHPNGCNTESAQHIFRYFLDGGYPDSFHELSPQEIEKLKLEQL